MSDLRRTIDYLETRNDLNTKEIFAWLNKYQRPVEGMRKPQPMDQFAKTSH